MAWCYTKYGLVYWCIYNPGIILYMCPAKERHCYIVTSSLIGWGIHKMIPVILKLSLLISWSLKWLGLQLAWYLKCEIYIIIFKINNVIYSVLRVKMSAMSHHLFVSVVVTSMVRGHYSYRKCSCIQTCWHNSTWTTNWSWLNLLWPCNATWHQTSW